MADENKRLDELERQVGNLGSELAATRTKLAEAEARADKAQTQAAALLAEQAESAAKALADERAALKAQCRASGQFIPGTVGEEVIDEMSIALLRKTAKEGKKLIPVGGAMQSGGGNGPEVSTPDKLSAFMIDKMGLTANDVEAQRRVNRSLKITDDMFIKQQIEGVSSDYVEGV